MKKILLPLCLFLSISLSAQQEPKDETPIKPTFDLTEFNSMMDQLVKSFDAWIVEDTLLKGMDKVFPDMDQFFKEFDKHSNNYNVEDFKKNMEDMQGMLHTFMNNIDMVEFERMMEELKKNLESFGMGTQDPENSKKDRKKQKKI